MMSPDEKSEDAARSALRQAERLAPLRRAFPLPPPDDRFALLLERLKGVTP